MPSDLNGCIQREAHRHGVDNNRLVGLYLLYAREHRDKQPESFEDLVEVLV